MDDELLQQILAEFRSLRQELKDTLKHIVDDHCMFRSETDANFRKLHRRMKGIETDLDKTMDKVAEITKKNK